MPNIIKLQSCLIIVFSLIGCSQEKPKPEPYMLSCDSKAIVKVSALKRIGYSRTDPKLVYFEQIKPPVLSEIHVEYYGNTVQSASGKATLYFKTGVVNGEYSCSFQRGTSNVYQYLGRFSDVSKKGESFVLVSIN